MLLHLLYTNTSLADNSVEAMYRGILILVFPWRLIAHALFFFQCNYSSVNLLYLYGKFSSGTILPFFSLCFSIFVIIIIYFLVFFYFVERLPLTLHNCSSFSQLLYLNPPLTIYGHTVPPATVATLCQASSDSSPVVRPDSGSDSVKPLPAAIAASPTLISHLNFIGSTPHQVCYQLWLGY